MIPESTIDRLAASLGGTDGRGIRYAAQPVDMDPLAFVRAGAGLFGRAFFFSNPDGESIGGLGTAWKATTSGSARFDAIRSQIDGLAMPDPVRAMVGFSFAADGPHSDGWEAFGAADTVVPLAAVVARGRDAALVIALPPGLEAEQILGPLRAVTQPAAPLYPDLGYHTLESVPSVADWRTAVTEAVDAISDDALR
jgi:hypothetical protein